MAPDIILQRKLRRQRIVIVGKKQVNNSWPVLIEGEEEDGSRDFQKHG